MFLNYYYFSKTDVVCLGTEGMGPPMHQRVEVAQVMWVQQVPTPQRWHSVPTDFIRPLYFPTKSGVATNLCSPNNKSYSRSQN